MADYDEEEDLEYLIESHGMTLYDVIEDRNRTLNKKSLLHRLSVICKMRHHNFQETGQYYEKYFRETSAQYQTEGVTGLLLLYPKHCVHVIEASSEILIDFIKDLRRQSQDPAAAIEKSKLLIVSHDIPHRLYQHWSFRILDIEAPKLDEYEPSEEIDKIVSDMLTQLLKLGSYINKQPKVALKNAMDSLHDKVPELLPQQGAIGYLLEHEEPCINTPEEFLAKYELPYDVVLESSLTWPMVQPLMGRH